MDTAGALRFDVQINPFINVSADELNNLNLETVNKLEPVKYENGTILRQTNSPDNQYLIQQGIRLMPAQYQVIDRYYLIQQGVRRLIPDETTFETMGLRKEQIISVVDNPSASRN